MQYIVITTDSFPSCKHHAYQVAVGTKTAISEGTWSHPTSNSLGAIPLLVPSGRARGARNHASFMILSSFRCPLSGTSCALRAPETPVRRRRTDTMVQIYATMSIRISTYF